MGRRSLTRTKMTAALRRLEKVVFFATVVGRSHGESGDARGVLGSEIWAEELLELESGGAVALDSARGGASLGTYTQPCVQLQLLAEGTPLGVPPRGREIAEIRRGALQAASIVDLIFGGGSVCREDVVAVAGHFSMNACTGDERDR